MWKYKYPHSYARHKIGRSDQLHVLFSSSAEIIENEARFAPHSVMKLWKQKDLLFQLSYWTDCTILAFRSSHTLKSAMDRSSIRRINYCIEWLLYHDIDGTSIICVERLNPLYLEFLCTSNGKNHPTTLYDLNRGGNRGIALLMPKLGARYELVLNTTIRPFCAWKRVPVSRPP